MGVQFQHTWELQGLFPNIKKLPQDVKACSWKVVKSLLDQGTHVESPSCVQEEFQTLEQDLGAQLVKGVLVVLGCGGSEDHISSPYDQFSKALMTKVAKLLIWYLSATAKISKSFWGQLISSRLNMVPSFGL